MTRSTTPGYARPDDWDEPLEITEVPRHKRVVVGLDGSDDSELALSHALRLLDSETELIIVVAFDPPLVGRKRGSIGIESISQEMEQDATELAEEAVDAVRARGHESRGIVVRGWPGEALIDIIEELEADMVVIGSYGLGRRRRALGSTAEYVVRTAEIPVLLVGEPDDE
jgi:nucleotide-binding universal stress UspA family protein